MTQNTGSPIRIGVVGLGRAGTFFHCRPVETLEQFELIAVCDSRPDVTEKVAAQYHCTPFTNYTDMLALSDLDLVVIAVPTSFHHDFAMAAIAAGKSILMEKPFATTAEEAGKIFNAGEQAGVFVGAYHNRRFDPDVLALKDILQSGQLGPILQVTIHLHAYTRRHDWQTSRSMGGGALSNWGSHALDWSFSLFGSDFTCAAARLMHVLNAGDAEDSFHLFLEQDGGPYVNIEYLNCAALSLPKWHVVGRFGTVLSAGKAFNVRYCNPDTMAPLQMDDGHASDGTYGFKEDLGWQQEDVPWGNWDNCPPFYESLWQHLKQGAPVPVEPCDIIQQLKLMSEIRKNPLHSYMEPQPLPQEATR